MGFIMGKKLMEVTSIKKMILRISIGHTEYFQTEVPSQKMVTIHNNNHFYTVFPGRVRRWMCTVGDGRRLSTMFNQNVPTF